MPLHYFKYYEKNTLLIKEINDFLFLWQLLTCFQLFFVLGSGINSLSKKHKSLVKIKAKERLWLAA